tara:strand:- start:486 stop:962 length:477 start_codon:yes stop_codon:yes gene_type:complete
MDSNSLEKRISDLEKLSHEPQNYREKCEEMEKRIDKLESRIDEFMDNWGPDVQRRRDERDARWDEMIRVLTVQERKREKGEFAKYDGDGKPLDTAGFPIKKINSYLTTDIKEVVMIGEEDEDKQHDFAEDLKGDRLVSEYNRNRPSEQWVKNVNEIPK